MALAQPACRSMVARAARGQAREPFIPCFEPGAEWPLFCNNAVFGSPRSVATQRQDGDDSRRAERTRHANIGVAPKLS
jgi:hypothetical protein